MMIDVLHHHHQNEDELAERGFAAMPKRRALVFLGHILESASPDEGSRFLRRRVPPAVRLLYRLVGRRAFTRETAALRAALAAPSRTVTLSDSTSRAARHHPAPPAGPHAPERRITDGVTPPAAHPHMPRISRATSPDEYG